MIRLPKWAIALPIMAGIGCSGGSDGAGSEAGSSAGDGSAAPAEQPAVPVPVQEPQGEPDAALAEQGEQVFTTRGCIACHFVNREQRLVGPDLGGVTGRREFGWFYHMVTNPDSMVRNDPAAQDLFGEYMTPMTDMNVQDDEVVALWEYLRRETASGGN